MGNAVVLWARGGYITAMFEYSPYPIDLARSSVLLFEGSSEQKHNQASSVMVGRLVILILAVTFDPVPATDVPWDPGIILSVELFPNTRAAASRRGEGFHWDSYHVTD